MSKYEGYSISFERKGGVRGGGGGGGGGVRGEMRVGMSGGVF